MKKTLRSNEELKTLPKMNNDLLKEYATDIAKNVALKFSAKVEMTHEEYQSLIGSIIQEVTFAFSGVVTENQ